MKNNLYKVFNRFVTGFLTMIVLVACGQDISLKDDEKKQEAKSELVSRTNSKQIQTRNVSYAKENDNSGHHYGQIEQFERKNIEAVQNYAKEIGFNATFTRVEEGIIMDIPPTGFGNWRPSEMVEKIMELYGIKKYPGGEEVVEGWNTYLIRIDSIRQEIQAKINELGLGPGLGGSSAYKLYGINQINVYTFKSPEDDEYQVKMEKLFKYIEEKVGTPITVDLFYDYTVPGPGGGASLKYYSVKW
ncbi:hypothetical protein [Neobacillus driksii]|uniref:hypothetical protein n=1 Tax=Neobacillus driksii TaxID=3035913 RepID=UPI0035BBA0E3